NWKRHSSSTPFKQPPANAPHDASLGCNGTDLLWCDRDPSKSPGPEPAWWLLGVLSIFCTATVSGNLLVIVAVGRESFLQSATNYFITSLAVADLLVGALVMPFGAYFEAMQTWSFGPDWCDVWHSIDVLASTSSILNLCVISLDRYMAVTDPLTYPAKVTTRRAFWLIAAVWVLSSLISFPAIGWWRSVATHPPEPNQCAFTEDLGYLAFSSTISFYAPLLIMVFTYCRIYKAAVTTTRSLRKGQRLVPDAHSLANGANGAGVTLLRIHRGGRRREQTHSACHSMPAGDGTSSRRGSAASYTRERNRDREPSVTFGDDPESRLMPPGQGSHSAPHSPLPPEGRGSGGTFRLTIRGGVPLSRRLTRLAKEQKAAKTLGIVMGVFIICWLPFFAVNVLIGVCKALKTECIEDPDLLFSAVTWLGWINSGMNPAIYAYWSKDFRRMNLGWKAEELQQALIATGTY
ncbi:unnamed protein product, partial [Cyprideis torosa]